jgi:hypothetical protein
MQVSPEQAGWKNKLSLKVSVERVLFVAIESRDHIHQRLIDVDLEVNQLVELLARLIDDPASARGFANDFQHERKRLCDRSCPTTILFAQCEPSAV